MPRSFLHILSSTIAGIVDRSHVIDGSIIQENDIVLAIASNGVHTNGYYLVQEQIGRYYPCYPIGKVEMGKNKVVFENGLIS